MVINITNGEIINTKDISLHDDILEEISFDRKNKKLHLILFRECDNRKISMFFLNVIAFEMTACDFWGESPYIFDFEYIAPDERTIIPKLFERKEKFDDPACTLGYPEMYIETEMTFVSGDRLIIACESIVM